MPSRWREQYDRMKRWYERFARIDQGLTHVVPSDNYVDEIYAFFQNCYHLKDWIKKDDTLPLSVPKEQFERSVEEFINDTRSLSLCADLCNSLKHLSLESDRSRSDEHPAFAGKTFAYSVGENSLSIKYEIKTDTGPVDAFSLATECVRDWDAFILRSNL